MLCVCEQVCYVCVRRYVCSGRVSRCVIVVLVGMSLVC